MRRNMLQHSIRTVVLALAGGAWLLLAGSADAAELLMYRRDGCPWCARWDRDIGPVYPKTDIGKRAPLRMVDLDRDRDESVVLRSPVRFTPTFVLVDAGREVARLEGYPSEHFFWPLLEKMIEKLPATSGAVREHQMQAEAARERAL